MGLQIPFIYYCPALLASTLRDRTQPHNNRFAVLCDFQSIINGPRSNSAVPNPERTPF